MPTAARLRRWILASLLLLATGSSVSPAQSSLVRPALDWMTVRTRYFEIHYPAPMGPWALELASRIDAVRDAVSAFVGYAPPRRVTIIVEDPLNQSNGFANVPIDAPFIVLWPTPPDPSGMLGATRDWPELLAVHEFAHVAHLVRPTRNPRERRFWQVLPIRLGPISRRTPRWAVEGYATYVEGRLTGAGRPYSASRAAYLRQWALEGKLPTYAQLSVSSEFVGGAMAYLAGSAFLEWLVEQRGESSLVAVWRRLSARQPRTFAQAFAGVYGGPPDELYGRFTVDLTRRAIVVRDTLAAAGLDTGTLVQRRRWATGDPAVSHDGKLMAVSLPNRTTPGPLVVWRTVERVDSTRERRAREQLLKLDPQDVPAVPGEPRPKAAVATLRPMRGRGFHSPRFFPDSVRLLVAHDDALGDDAYRTDLYEWNYRTGGLRRITRRAGVQDADLLPDGRTAIGARCENGSCDLVAVDLASGAVTVRRRGTPTSPIQHPRVSPDGRVAVVNVQQGGRWRLALVSLDTTGADQRLELIGPDDDGNRYHASFLPGGRAIVCVSETGGVPNLELIELNDASNGSPQAPRTRQLTRTTSAVFAPAPNPADGSVFFLALHARGMDVRRVSVALADPSRRVAERIALSPSLAPAVPLAPAPADTFARSATDRPHSYGIGPRRHRVLPGGNYSGEGAMASLSLIGTDPVGRLGYVMTAGIGERSAWRGVSLAGSWRGSRSFAPGVMSIDGTLFHAEQRPSAQRTFGDVAPASVNALDATQTGGSLGLSMAHDFGQARLALGIGTSVARLDRPEEGSGTRGLAFGEVRAAMRVRRDGYRADVALRAHASGGTTADSGWSRAIGTVAVDAMTPFGGGRLDASLGGTDGGVTFEQFAIGGWPSPFVDAPVLSQRVALPALPAGFAIGRRVATVRASTAFGPVRPYYWVGSTADGLDTWTRVAGVDVEVVSERLSALVLPAMTVRGGAAYSWDEPFAHRVGFYLGISYRP